jgi:hypothetical protein
MTSTFTTNSGFTTFGVFKESQSTTDYILNKKAKTTFCKANVCAPNKSVGSQGQLELLRKANNLKYYDCDDSFDKTNLNINLITKLDLTDVCVIQNKATPPVCPTPLGSQTRVDASGVTIDPHGSLFGNDVCGINNFTRYMVYNPPANVTATRIAKLNLGVLLSFSHESMKLDVDRKTRRRNRYLNEE